MPWCGFLRSWIVLWLCKTTFLWRLKVKQNWQSHSLYRRLLLLFCTRNCEPSILYWYVLKYQNKNNRSRSQSICWLYYPNNNSILLNGNWKFMKNRRNLIVILWFKIMLISQPFLTWYLFTKKHKKIISKNRIQSIWMFVLFAWLGRFTQLKTAKVLQFLQFFCRPSCILRHTRFSLNSLLKSIFKAIQEWVTGWWIKNSSHLS